MDHYVMLIERKNGWYVEIDSEKLKGYPLSDKDLVYAKSEAKRYARKLGLSEITIIDSMGYESKIFLD